MSEKGVTVAASGGVEHLLLGWHTSCYYGLHEDAKNLWTSHVRKLGRDSCHGTLNLHSFRLGISIQACLCGALIMIMVVHVNNLR